LSTSLTVLAELFNCLAKNVLSSMVSPLNSAFIHIRYILLYIGFNLHLEKNRNSIAPCFKRTYSLFVWIRLKRNSMPIMLVHLCTWRPFERRWSHFM